LLGVGFPKLFNPAEANGRGVCCSKRMVEFGGEEFGESESCSII
jgi:hypothetical protein